MVGKKIIQEPSSFRDPSGQIFFMDGEIYRKISFSYGENYDMLMKSGLYGELIEKGLLIPHKEIRRKIKGIKDVYKLISPEVIPFISYPYEWSFGQLKAAALLTLQIQNTALKYGMVLKDASAYNIQFLGVKPVFIDTLSFEKYDLGKTWVAYRQFCKHFLAPLALMSLVDIRMSKLLNDYIDGVPLDLTSRLLPKKSRLRFGLLTHIHLNALSMKRFIGEGGDKKRKELSKEGMISIVENLGATVKKLEVGIKITEWSDYYQDTNYKKSSFRKKKRMVTEFVSRVNPKMSLDLGANTGIFSQVMAKFGVYTISSDMDSMAVEKNFNSLSKQEGRILPLVIDLTNPSAGIGWGNLERKSFLERCEPVDLVLALALVHHLAIGNNLPFGHIAEVFKGLGKYLIVEFVPKADSQVVRLLSQREDIFGEYSQENFEKVFGQYFDVLEKKLIQGTKRFLYLMKRKNE